MPYLWGPHLWECRERKKLRSSPNVRTCKTASLISLFPQRRGNGTCGTKMKYSPCCDWQHVHPAALEMQTRRIRARAESRRVDKMTHWQDEHLGEKEPVTKAMCLSSHKRSAAGAESPSLEPLCKHSPSVYTSAHGEIPPAALGQEEKERGLLVSSPFLLLLAGSR